MGKLKQAGKGVVSWVLAGVLVVGLMPAFPPASAFAEDGLQAADAQLGAADADAQLEAQAAIPSTYDLRDEGVVTPVKQQSPWGSCWAFGGIAAAETSILSDAGVTYEESGLDLSEKHLAWYALHPITAQEDANQAGEGIYLRSEATSGANAAYDAGGLGIFITTLFSSGTSPQAEEDFPYRGSTGLTELQYMTNNEDAWKQAQYEQNKQSVEKGEMTEEQLRGIVDRAYAETLANLTANDYYSKQDDWTIPASGQDGYSNRLRTNGYLLKDGNVLPPTANFTETTVDGVKKKTWQSLNDEGVRAIKQELLNGRAVSTTFCADTSQPSQLNSRNESNYINLDNWAHYTYEDKDITHAVCIVGWDDSYSKDNFAHPLKGVSDDDDAKRLTTPPGDGAWIVKNSWGSEADKDESQGLNGGTWGVKDATGKSTGYFYLSYYDKSMQDSETMTFGTDMGSQSFHAMQYDYLPADGGYMTLKANTELSSANVFTAEEAMKVPSVSTSTPEANMRVTFRVYKLGANANSPTDGQLVASCSRNFEYAGFHRITLDQPFQVAKGEAFSVVTTASAIGDNGVKEYGISAAQMLNEQAAIREKSDFYGKAVVNKGESFLKTGGSWYDWADFLGSSEAVRLISDRQSVEIDNFSIKAYGIPTQEEAPAAAQQMHRLYNPNSGEHFFTANTAERDMLMGVGWRYEGKAWDAPAAGAEVYRLYNANGGEHHYTMDAGERNALVALGWSYEGVGWLSAGSGGVPLYRVYNPNEFANNHHYTTSQAERNYLLSLGWRTEGIGWYGV